jgi:hypothetical protein
LDDLILSTPYQRKKESLRSELEGFLTSCTRHSIYSAQPADIRRFLVWKDRKGKTQVHGVACPYLGIFLIQDCGCPVRLAAGTVRSLVGQLRDIFRRAGRDSVWQEGSDRGNPACSASVNMYVQAVSREQAISHVPVQQAIPMFSRKLELISLFIEGQLNQAISPCK